MRVMRLKYTEGARLKIDGMECVVGIRRESRTRYVLRLISSHDVTLEKVDDVEAEIAAHLNQDRHPRSD